MTPIRQFILAICCLLYISASAQDDPGAEPDYNSENLIRTSTTGENYDATWQNDFNSPPGAPLIVLIHGGGFLGGTPADMCYYQSYFRQKGYKTISVGYRLIDEEYFCSDLGWWQAIQDVHAWIKFAVWLKNQGNPNHDFDPDNVILFGSSAGAVTALTLTYTDDQDLQNYLPAAYSLYGGLNASCSPLTHNLHYSIKGTVSAAGAISNIIHTPGYDFTENTSVYLLHGTEDLSVSELQGRPQSCTGGVRLHGSSYLMGDCSYHNLVGLSCSVPGSPLIVPSPVIYSSRHYVKNYSFNDHNHMSDPLEFPLPSSPPVSNPCSLSSKTTSNDLYLSLKSPGLTLYNTSNPGGFSTQSIEDWVNAVVNSPVPVNVQK